MLINCDLGECENLAQLEQQNHAIMPAIDLSNIACGGHRGNEETMSLCITHCLQYQVGIGAHPSYPDSDNFGRISMATIMPIKHLYQSIVEQVSALMDCCQQQQTSLSHIKPHGALYHDCQDNVQISRMIGQIAKEFDLPLILSFPKNSEAIIMASFEEDEIVIWHEAFADRAYQKNGKLVPRIASLKNELTEKEINKQFKQLNEQKPIKAENSLLKLTADTVCFHSDNKASLSFLSKLI